MVKNYRGGGSTTTQLSSIGETKAEATERIRRELYAQLKDKYSEDVLKSLPGLQTKAYAKIDAAVNQLTLSSSRNGVKTWVVGGYGKDYFTNQAEDVVKSAIANPTQFLKDSLADVYSYAGRLYFNKGEQAAFDYAKNSAKDFIDALSQRGVGANEIQNIYSTSIQSGFNQAKSDATPSQLEKVFTTVLPIAVANILAPGLGSALGSAALGTGAATAIVTGMTTGDLEKALASGLLAGTVSHLTTPTATQIPEGGADLYADLADAHEATRGADLFTVQDDLVAQATPSPVEPAIQTRSYETELPVEVTEGAGPVEYEVFTDQITKPSYGYDYGYGPGENVAPQPTTDIYQGFEDLVPPPTQEFGVGMDGLPPVVDRSIAYDPTVPDTPLGEAIQDLAGAAGEYAINNPLQTAAMLSGAASLASSSGGAEESSPTPVRRVYTYGTAPPIRRTGLQELYSAAADIYGNEEPVVRPQPVTEPPAFEYTPLPVLSGAAPGGGQYGLGSLARTSQMAAPGAFEIGNLTPQQIAMIQQMMTNPVRGETR